MYYKYFKYIETDDLFIRILNVVSCPFRLFVEIFLMRYECKKILCELLNYIIGCI